MSTLDLEGLKRQLRAELRAEMRKEMKAELARLFMVFAHLVTQSAANDEEEPIKPRGLGLRPRKTKPSPVAEAHAKKQLRKLGLLP